MAGAAGGDAPAVSGCDFAAPPQQKGAVVDWDAFAAALGTTGFEATQLAEAVRVVRAMAAERRAGRCRIILAFTSNLISCGLRECFAWLARHKQVDVVVTTAGGVEEDFIKCLGHTYLGDFALPGKDLRLKGLNRIANMLVPNDNYCKFEEWFVPILNKMKEEQDTGAQWTPSRLIHRAGVEIGDETSFYNQCARSDIPVFCPSLSDGSIGDMLFFNSYKTPGLVLDTAGDLEHIAQAVAGGAGGEPCPVGVICLGGGLPKHHALLAARLAGCPVTSLVLVSTGQRFDGSESGMDFDDDASWGRLADGCDTVRLHSEATLAFPIIAHLAWGHDPAAPPAAGGR